MTMLDAPDGVAVAQVVGDAMVSVEAVAVHAAVIVLSDCVGATPIHDLRVDAGIYLDSSLGADVAFLDDIGAATSAS
jgi:hypothetical protein